MTDYLTVCPNPQCKLVYRPDLCYPFRVNKDGSTDTPPEEYCPQCGFELAKAKKLLLGVVDD